MSTIYFTENPDRKRFVASLLAKFRNNIQGKVLIKVNLVSYNPYPTTTHPDMIEAVYDQIKFDDRKLFVEMVMAWMYLQKR